MLYLTLMLIALLLVREVMHDNERIRWQKERVDLIARIQAGSLKEYEATKFEPGRARVKNIDQRANEYAHDKGVTVASLKKPQGWRSW